MQQIDIKKTEKLLYAPSAKAISIIDVPAMRFLMIDGAGDPNNSPIFQEAVETLFTVSYTIKFLVRETQQIDYGVLPLEGLWWMDDMRAFSLEAKDQWQYTVMIRQPDFVTDEEIARAMETAARKNALPALPQMRVETYHEGLSAQIMHIGPFAAEGPTVAALHKYITDSGHTLCGKHHEIYVSDFRRTAPEKRKAIIRQPMQK